VEDEVLFEDGIMLIPINKEIPLKNFSNFYISGLGFICAKTPYMVVLSESIYTDPLDTQIRSEKIVGVEYRGDLQYIKIFI
jgi:hypothetical protein